MTLKTWILCSIFHPWLTLQIVGKKMRSRWLDARIWWLERKNRKLRARVAALKAQLGILRPD